MSDRSDGLIAFLPQYPYHPGEMLERLTRIEHGLFHWNLFVSDRSDGFHRIPFLPQYPYHLGEMLERLTQIEHGLFHWNLFVSDRSDGFHRIAFIHQYLIWLKFSKSPTNSTRTFPLESVHIRWNRWIPSDRVSTSISNISVNSQSVSKKNMHFSIGIYLNPIEPIYSIELTFYPNIHIIRVKFLSLTRIAHKHFHWNLFVSDRSNRFHFQLQTGSKNVASPLTLC